MPPYGAVVPRVEASLFQNWEYIFDWLTRMQQRRIQVTPEIEQAVQEITAGAADLEEKVARIYHFIQRYIRYISIKGSIGSGWSGHEAFYMYRKESDHGRMLANWINSISPDATLNDYSLQNIYDISKPFS